MKINHRYYILILLALCSLFASGVGYVVLYEHIVTQARESTKAVKEVLLENDRRDREQELALLYADTLSDRSKLSALIVSEKKIVEFIEAVEKIGADTGTNLSLSAINAPDLGTKPEGTTAQTQAHVEVRGTWNNIFRALTLLENMPYSLSVRGVKLYTVDIVPSTPTKKPASPVQKEWVMSLDIQVLTSK